MLLAIDVGNTQTVIGMFGPATGQPVRGPSELLHHWRIATDAERTADELALLLAQLLDLQGFDIDRTVTGIAVASVVPRLRAALREMTEKWFPVKTVIVEPGIRTGMPILYDNPKEVGADRIADAVAAYELYGGPTIVIDFGTATTFEAISAQGRVPRRGHHPRHRDLPRRPVRPGRRPHPGRAGRAPQRDRQEHRRVHPVRRRVRLRRPGRRAVRPLRGGARPVHRGGHRRAWPA